MHYWRNFCLNIGEGELQLDDWDSLEETHYKFTVYGQKWKLVCEAKWDWYIVWDLLVTNRVAKLGDESCDKTQGTKNVKHAQEETLVAFLDVHVLIYVDHTKYDQSDKNNTNK